MLVAGLAHLPGLAVENLSLTGRRWALAPADPAEIDALATEQRLSPVAARCLLLRAGRGGAVDWLHPSPTHFHDPMLMRGMDVALDRIREAVRRKEAIRIVTDYDVDGTTSSLILRAAIGTLAGPGGCRVDYHIPHRFDEGYGFSVRAAEAAARDGVGLIVTADIGVRDHAAVHAAAAAGVDVIVCDHHLPAGESVPAEARAVLCPPQEGCPYPNKALAACGVSLKLSQALLQGHPKRDALLRSMLKMAAIGTVADIVDLSTLENRAIVSLGLDALRAGPHTPGLSALLAVSGLGSGQIEASDLGFRLGPRINAAGRLAEATAVIELMDERDPTRAAARAAGLDRLNVARQQVQERLLARCLAQITGEPPPFVVLWGPEEEGWHRGVVGIVAARLRERLHRPVAIIAVAGEEGRGSVRSIPEVHAVAALESAADLLIRFGGHPVAAGFSVRTRELPALAARLADHVRAAIGAAGVVPALEVDARCALSALDSATVEALATLGPHGKGNPTPLLQLEPAVPERVQRAGERHLKFQLGEIEAVWWGGAAHADALRGPVELVATAGKHSWQGRTKLRLTVEDARPVSRPPL